MPNYRTDEASAEALQDFKTAARQNLEIALRRINAYEEHRHFLAAVDTLFKFSDNICFALLLENFHTLWADIHGIDAYSVKRTQFEFMSRSMEVELLQTEIGTLSKALYDTEPMGTVAEVQGEKIRQELQNMFPDDEVEVTIWNPLEKGDLQA